MTDKDHVASWSVGAATTWRREKADTKVLLTVCGQSLGVCPYNAEFIAQQLLLAAKAVRETNAEEEKQ